MTCADRAGPPEAVRPGERPSRWVVPGTAGADIVCTMRMRLAQAGCAGLLALAGLGMAATTAAAGWSSTANEVATLRSQATRFVTAEINGDGATACAVLNAPWSGVVDHRTCTQRWDASLHTLLRTPGARRQLRADAAAIPTARVDLSADGYTATIALPTPLFASLSRFVWTNNCWMLER